MLPAASLTYSLISPTDKTRFFGVRTSHIETEIHLRSETYWVTPKDRKENEPKRNWARGSSYSKTHTALE